MPMPFTAHKIRKGGEMNRTIALLTADRQEAKHMGRVIEEGPYQTVFHSDLVDLESGIRSTPCIAVILDVDSVRLDNRTIRRLAATFPAVSFFCTSRDRFHPDLEEAICHYLFACLAKPVNPDELHYFLKCISDPEESESRAPPDP